eukprot:9481859-Pyramimonas_sp.AAC.2
MTDQSYAGSVIITIDCGAGRVCGSNRLILKCGVAIRLVVLLCKRLLRGRDLCRGLRTPRRRVLIETRSVNKLQQRQNYGCISCNSGKTVPALSDESQQPEKDV